MIAIPLRTRRCLWLEPNGLGLPLYQFIPHDGANKQLELEQRLLRPGDLLVLFTDGVTEMTNTAHEEFGDSRLAQVITRNAAASAEELKSILLAELATFRSGTGLRDDLTLVVLKWLLGHAFSLCSSPKSLPQETSTGVSSPAVICCQSPGLLQKIPFCTSPNFPYIRQEEKPANSCWISKGRSARPSGAAMVAVSSISRRIGQPVC